MKITFTYEDHEPSSYSLQNQDAAPILSCGESLRIWTNNIRDFRVSSNGGLDLILDPSGAGAGSFIRSGEEFDAELFAGLIDGDGQIILYIEAVDVVARSPITVEVDIKNIGKIEDTVYVSTIKTGFAVDANRDETIEFDSLEDCLIKTINPDGTNNVDPVYNFWVNNNKDFHIYDEQYESNCYDEINMTTRDCDDSIVNSLRDLQDLSRIQIEAVIPAGLSKELFAFTLDTQDNAVNFFRETQKNTEMEYLKIREDLDGIIWHGPFAMFNCSQIPENPFKQTGVAPFLFEGCRSGHVDVRLDVQYYVSQTGAFQSIATRNLELNLVDLDSVDSYSGLNLEEDSTLYGSPFATSSDLFVFVHGWNMKNSDGRQIDKRQFARSTFKMLWWQGYSGSVLAYNWPCLWQSLLHNPLHNTFNASENIAWEESEKLKDMLMQQYPRNVSLLAHSQGNVVASEAIKKLPAYTVGSYIATNAAISRDAYCHIYNQYTDEIGDPDWWGAPNIYGNYYDGVNGYAYFSTLFWQTTMHNYYLPDDKATSVAWVLNNDMFRPDLDPEWDNLLGVVFGLLTFPLVPWQYDYEDNDGSTLIYTQGPGQYTDRYYRQLGNTLYFEADKYELFSRCVKSWSYALGTMTCDTSITNYNLDKENPNNPQSDVNLNFNISHSQQFRSYPAECWKYWERVLSNSGLTDLSPLVPPVNP